MKFLDFVTTRSPTHLGLAALGLPGLVIIVAYILWGAAWLLFQVRLYLALSTGAFYLAMALISIYRSRRLRRRQKRAFKFDKRMNRK